MGKWTRSYGFTLIELLMIVLLVSIIAVFLAPKLVSVPGTTVSSQAERLATDLRYTQALAMSNSGRYHLALSANGYQIFNSAAPGTPLITSSGSTTAAMNTGVTISVPGTLTNSLVQFDALGTPYVTSTTTGGTTLAATATITINGGGANAKVTITPETGRVNVS